MAILRSRGELLPVTCAVLKDDVREDFFGALKKKTGGRMEKIAAACGLNVSSLNAWAKGEKLPPYHLLQRLASEFSLEMPQISELRREFQQVEEAPKAKSRPQIPPPEETRPAAAEPAAAPVASPPPAPAPQSREDRPEKSSRRGGRRKRRKPSAPNPAAPAESTAPESAQKAPEKLSEDRAYWSGILLARGRRDETHVRLLADRAMSQNFASTWANLTQAAFGVRPELILSDDHSEQTASLPAAEVASFLERIDFKPGAEPARAPGAPRWAWSNENWKKAFLKGVVDASSHFHRTPALRLENLSEKLALSALKMFSSCGLEAKAAEGGLIVLEGEEQVRKYYETIGTANPKLKDQLSAYFGELKNGAPPSALEQKAGEPQKPTTRRRRRSRRRGPRRSKKT